LPGILQSGLWDDLARHPRVPTAALITDVGNDLLYHAPPEQVIDWVRRCLDRLADVGAKTIVTGLPVANLERLGALRFAFFRTLFVPTCKLALKETVARAWEVHNRLVELTGQRGVPLVPLRPEWYGLDPIHLRMRHWPAAWGQIVRSWAEEQAEESLTPSLTRWLRLRALAPERRWLLGIEQRRTQPSARWRDGTTISFY
jgi:hypothetical protein